MPPIRLALAGAGLFARDAHLPAIKGLGDTFEIVAVYSYRKSSAAGLLEALPYPVELYDNLETMLERTDIEAVDVMLPIDIMPSAVEQILKAGKHVVSEKPVAAEVSTGRRLLALHAQHAQQVWMVAENWRYEPAFRQVAEIIGSGEIGRPFLVTMLLRIDMSPRNKYYHTEWRRTGTWQGGFLMDGGVHHIAALRQMIGEISEVSAISALQRPDLPPTDTLSAALRFDNGAVGCYSVTYAAGSPWPSVVRVVGEKGSLALIERERIEITVDGTTREISVPPVGSVGEELAAFAASIRDGVPHANSPSEALQDVAVIEAMLRSAQTGQRVQPERV